MTNERLDEAIDRVAQAMTAVPADPNFSARLADRLQRRTWNLTPWILAASAAAIVLVVGIGIFNQEGPASASVRLELPARYGETAPKRATGREGGVRAVAARLGPAAPNPVTARSAPRAFVTTEIPDELIALDVAELTLESLTIPPVDVGPLDVATLELAAIDPSSDVKEPT